MNTEKGIVEVFNMFFASIIKNLNISQYSDFDPIAEKVKDSILKAILKYKEHPSILAIWTRYNGNGTFSFSKVSLKQSEAKAE